MELGATVPPHESEAEWWELVSAGRSRPQSAFGRTTSRITKCHARQLASLQGLVAVDLPSGTVRLLTNRVTEGNLSHVRLVGPGTAVNNLRAAASAASMHTGDCAPCAWGGFVSC